MPNLPNNHSTYLTIYLLGYQSPGLWRAIFESWSAIQKSDDNRLIEISPDQVWALPVSLRQLLTLADYPLMQTITITTTLRAADLNAMMLALRQVCQAALPTAHWFIRSGDQLLHRQTIQYTPEQHDEIQQLTIGGGVSKLGGTRWMGIINVTPDSFSDGGVNDDLETLRCSVQGMLKAGASIIDLGGQSTRPGATVLEVDAEWQRLAPAIAVINELLADWPIATQLSIDTYHPAIAQRAIKQGATMINDVSGLTDPNMQVLVRDFPHVSWVAMHHLGLPVDPSVTLPPDHSPDQLIDAINTWALSRLAQLRQDQALPTKLYLDPGIGFGKTAKQNALLLQQCHRLTEQAQWLIGHSRKSYLNPLLSPTPGTATAKQLLDARDVGTTATTLNLIAQRCPVIRVHNVSAARLAECSFLATTALSG